MLNIKTAIFVVNPSTRALKVRYSENSSDKDAFVKTVNADIKVDDLVVIPTDTRFGFTVAKVIEVDVLINMNGTAEMRWVDQVVDKARYDHLVEQERIIIQKVQQADVRREQRQLAEQLKADGLTAADFTGIDLVTAPALAAPEAK
jgi:hypothetical protein